MVERIVCRMRGKRILVIEDDLVLSQLITTTFGREGAVVEENDGHINPLRHFFEFQPDLVLLDIMLPLANGWEIARQIRQLANTPIIVVTALSDEEAALKAYESGADAFVTKPFSVKVLVAQADAVLQRAAATGRVDASRVYADKHLVADLVSRKVEAAGQAVILTRTEFRLLRLLLVNRDHTVSFADILLSVWGEGYVTEIAFVHTYISRLRRKIEPDPKEPKYLIGERGLGYCFVSHD